MARKKVVFVIVEGPSDEEALGVVLTELYSSDEVYVEITHGDITSEFIETPGKNILTSVSNIVKKYAKSYHFKQTHFKEIIHIVDTDGAFIPKENVVEDKTAIKPIYLLNEIRTKNKAGLENRNRRKSDNIKKLCSKEEVWGIPYQVYYMSCNLDHVLYNKQNSNDKDKESDAFQFAKFYENKAPDFLKFISKSDFSVGGDYRESWAFIMKELNSLHRHTNLGICFRGITEE